MTTTNTDAPGPPDSRRKLPQNVSSVSQQLRLLALARKPNEKLPTRNELGRLLGTSVATIHHALNELEEQHVIYRRQGSGIYVSPHLTRKNIVVLLDAGLFGDYNATPFWWLLWGLITRETEKRAATGDVQYLFHMAGNRPEDPQDQEWARGILKNHIHAFVAVGTSFALSEWLLGQGVPVVNFASTGNYFVVLDEGELYRMGVEALVRQGCRRLACFSPGVAVEPDRARQSSERFAHLLGTSGCEVRPERVIDYRSGDRPLGASGQDQGYEAMREAARLPEALRPDGILVTNDMMADGVIAALYDLRWRIGENIQIATHANRNSTILYGSDKYMTVIEYDPAEIVQALLDMAEQDGLDPYRTTGQDRVRTVLPRLRPHHQPDAPPVARPL